MDTEYTLPAHESLREFDFEPLEGDDLEIVLLYVEMCRHLKEIQTLFMMFQFNLDNMLSAYEFQRSGDVLRRDDKLPALDETDYIAINAFVTNLISAGKTATQSMETYVKEHYAEDDAVLEDYIQYCKDTYDTVFSYSFLIRLRDYAQHGHTPVNKRDGWYGFDLKQILEKPHYQHNASMRKKFEEIITEVAKKNGDIPLFSLTLCLAEFTAAFFSISAHFWQVTIPLLAEIFKKFKKVVQDHPNNICTQGDYPDVFIYDYDKTYERMAHAFFVDDCSIDELKDFANEARAVADKYMKICDELKEGMAIVLI